jgi:hypothetical protein
LEVVKSALGKVLAATRIQLPLLYLYLCPKVRCIAFMGEAGGNRTYHMFLGDKVFQKTGAQLNAKASGIVGGMDGGIRGVADQMYDAKRKSTLNPTRWIMSKEDYQAAKANAKAEAVVVHELGHILQEKEHSEEFWTTKKNRGAGGGMGAEFQEVGVKAKPTHAPPKLANQVSQYAGTGFIEFVAEVFTGLVYGKQYSKEVIEAYVSEGGVEMVMDPRTKRV